MPLLKARLCNLPCKAFSLLTALPALLSRRAWRIFPVSRLCGFFLAPLAQPVRTKNTRKRQGTKSSPRASAHARIKGCGPRELPDEVGFRSPASSIRHPPFTACP